MSHSFVCRVVSIVIPTHEFKKESKELLGALNILRIPVLNFLKVFEWTNFLIVSKYQSGTRVGLFQQRCC